MSGDPGVFIEPSILVFVNVFLQKNTFTFSSKATNVSTPRKRFPISSKVPNVFFGKNTFTFSSKVGNLFLLKNTFPSFAKVPNVSSPRKTLLKTTQNQARLTLIQTLFYGEFQTSAK